MSWEDQWRRIMRWRNRVERGRDQPREDADGTEGYRDEVFALFQALWHLKDWLKNDPVTRAGSGQAVERWIGCARCLLIAADLANGSKHLAFRSAKDKRAEGSSQTRNDVTIVGGRGVMHKFYVQDARVGGREYEAVELADLCVDEWRTFIVDQFGLTLPSTT